MTVDEVMRSIAELIAPRYFRRGVEAERIQEVPCNEVRRIGINISQIARALNQLVYRLNEFKKPKWSSLFSLGVDFDRKDSPTTEELKEQLDQIQQEMDGTREELTAKEGEQEQVRPQGRLQLRDWPHTAGTEETRELFNTSRAVGRLSIMSWASPRTNWGRPPEDYQKCLEMGYLFAERAFPEQEVGIFVHGNTENVHCHILVHSVSIEDVRKLQLKKGRSGVILNNRLMKNMRGIRNRA